MSEEFERAAIVESIAVWVADWGAEVAAVDFDAGMRRFDPDAVAFGTHADVVIGVEHIAAQQWHQVWPNIAEFAFDVDHLVVLADGDDADLAVAIVPWSSVGFDEEGHRFARPGRATIVLRRRSPGAPGPEWLAVHTHFSLASGTPPRSFGPLGVPASGDRT
jgi:ketosteroid isomerase-like protein